MMADSLARGSAGVSHMAADGAFVTFAATVKTANSLLNTTFMNYQNGAVSKIRTSEYSIPEDLVDYIDLIDPTVFLGKTATSTRKTSADAPTQPIIDAACATSITPTCLKELYNTVGYTPDPTSGSRVGFGSFLNESAIYDDLFQFEGFFGIPHQNISTILITNATNDQDTATAQFGEANLDVSFPLFRHSIPAPKSNHQGVFDGDLCDNYPPNAHCHAGAKHYWNQSPAPSNGVHHWRLSTLHPQS